MEQLGCFECNQSGFNNKEMYGLLEPGLYRLRFSGWLVQPLGDVLKDSTLSASLLLFSVGLLIGFPSGSQDDGQQQSGFIVHTQLKIETGRLWLSLYPKGEWGIQKPQ